MTKKEITINGNTYPIAFTMDTMINFEEIADKSFFDTDLKRLKDRMAIIMAAVITADENTKLTVEELRGSGDLAAVQQIIAAFNVVMEASTEFFKIPAVEPKDEKPADEQTDEDKAKN